MAKVVRMPRLLRLFRMARVLRLLKIMKMREELRDFRGKGSEARGQRQGVRGKGSEKGPSLSFIHAVPSLAHFMCFVLLVLTHCMLT